MSATSIDLKLEGVGHALSDNKLAVPTYQRSYAWEEKHITDLFLDITSAIQSKEKEYFLGSIVVTQNEDGRLIVVDGQQRLATITILLAAMRDYFLENGDDSRAGDITSMYLSKRHIRTQEIEPKLKLNELDNDYFYKRVILVADGVKIEAIKESHKRIDKAMQIAKDQISRLTKSTGTPVDLILDLEEYIANNIKVIWVKVPDYSNAFTIFETLNDRGLELAISDLLKNYLFYKSEDRIKETLLKWNSMASIIETNADEEEIVDYIRYLWSSNYGVARQKDLYEVIKKKITSKQMAVDFADVLYKNSRLYSALLNPEHEYWNDVGAKSNNYISTLKLLGMVQVRPLLLAILDKFSNTEIVKCLRLLTSAVVRYTISGTLSTGVFEKQFSQWAVDIRGLRIKNASELLQAMKKSVPSDKEFEEEFSRASVSRGNLARYYLLSLERKAASAEYPELIPNSNEQEVNLEHIIPLILSDGWKDIDVDDAKTYSRRLGNMCLMQAKINSKTGNGSFDEKKEFYKTSELKFTSSLSEYDEWGTSQIDERQRILAQLAVKTWPINIS